MGVKITISERKKQLVKISGYPRKFEEKGARKIVFTREKHPKNPFSRAFFNFSGNEKLKSIGCEYIFMKSMNIFMKSMNNSLHIQQSS